MTTKYHPLEFEDVDVGEEHQRSQRLGSQRRSSSIPYRILAWSPYILNILLLFGLFYQRSVYQRINHSDYANLKPEVTVDWTRNTPYASADMEMATTLWEEIDLDNGYIAVDKNWAKDHDLPVVDDFPWDESKTVYIMNAHHNLHCLKSIHLTLAELVLGRNLSWPLAHITHCLDAFRIDIICQADDTPSHFGDGVTQTRKCRNWEELENWGKKHTACYKYFNASEAQSDSLSRFTYCPEGEGQAYQAKIDEYRESLGF